WRLLVRWCVGVCVCVCVWCVCVCVSVCVCVCVCVFLYRFLFFTSCFLCHRQTFCSILTTLSLPSSSPCLPFSVWALSELTGLLPNGPKSAASEAGRLIYTGEY